jgi:hypothetical protein
VVDSDFKLPTRTLGVASHQVDQPVAAAPEIWRGPGGGTPAQGHVHILVSAPFRAWPTATTR